MMFLSLALLLSASLTFAQNCNVQIPDNPLTAAGLSTVFLLSNVTGDPNSGTCSQANGGTGTFVQGTVINLDTGAVSVYNPLVINKGTTAAIAPTVPTLPTNNVVALWFGFNGGKLFLINANGGPGGTQGNCVNGFGGTVFGEFSSCNAVNFFNAAKNAILQGQLAVPALGTAKDGKPCPTIRDFAIIDQDQSDNVATQYLTVTTNGVTKYAQDTPANRKKLGVTTFVANPSDNRLLCNFILPALGCVCWTVPDLADTTTPAQNLSALPLNELMAELRQATPQALIPVNDPMASLYTAASVDKVNAYRVLVNQPKIVSALQADAVTYCTLFVNTAFSRLQGAMTLLQNFASPDGAVSGNLFNFLVNTRFPVSFGATADGGLNCINLGLANPFTAAAAGGTSSTTTAAKVQVQIDTAGNQPFNVQCLNNQWTLPGMTLQVMISVNGGAPQAPTTATGLPTIMMAFTLNGANPTVTVSGTFNVAGSSTANNVWTFTLMQFQPNIGATVVLQTAAGCKQGQTVPTVKATFSTNTMVNVGGTMTTPVISNMINAVNNDQLTGTTTSSSGGISTSVALIAGVSVGAAVLVGGAAFVGVRAYKKRRLSTAEAFISL